MIAHSTSGISVTTHSESFTGAVGVGAEANETSDPRGTVIGSASSPMLTAVQVGEGSTVRAGVIDLVAHVVSISATGGRMDDGRHRWRR